MQNPDMITFRCPNCSMMLQVPAQMAGVTGPCPECSASISAPLPSSNTDAVVDPATTPRQPDTIPTSPIPQSTQQPEQQPDQPGPPAQGQVMVAPNPLRQKSTPAPQENPTRSEPSAVGRESVLQPTRQPKQKPRAQWMRVVFPLTFLIVAGLLIFVVLETVAIFNDWNSKNEQDELIITTPATTVAKPADPSEGDDGNKEIVPPKPEATPPSDKTSTPHSSNPSDTTPSAPSTNTETNTHAEGEFPDLQLPKTSIETTSTGSRPPPPTSTISPPVTSVASDDTITPEDQSPPKAGFLANQVINQFLAAKTLDERLPLMSKSIRTRDELMSSSLAAPFKTLRSIYFAEMVPRKEDNMAQYLYFVCFEDETEDKQQHRIVMQVVERPGTHPPLVHTDAFIDHYEKKFAAYAKHPNKDVATFHCIAEARTANLAKELPEEIKDSMIRLVIKSHPAAAPAFDAYLNKNSPLMKQIGPRKDFPYTESRFCVLSFRWNTTHPDKPYIELNDIVGQGWER